MRTRRPISNGNGYVEQTHTSIGKLNCIAAQQFPYLENEIRINHESHRISRQEGSDQSSVSAGKYCFLVDV